MANGYGISKWEDANKINAELKELTSQPIYCVSEDALKQILEHFNTKCAKSKEITTEQRSISPAECNTILLSTIPSPCAWKKRPARIFTIVTAINT